MVTKDVKKDVKKDAKKDVKKVVVKVDKKVEDVDKKPEYSTPKKLKKKYEESMQGETLYVVDSLHMPHSFVIYNTTKLPHLIQLRPKHMISEDYLPNIFNKLKIT